MLEFDVPSQPGNERQAAMKVLECLSSSGLSPARLQRLETAVGEATMNAMEHGNQYRADLPVEIEIFLAEISTTEQELTIRIRDYGGQSGKQAIPQPEPPDLDAKLAGLQTPRGWGLFLINNMVDEMHVTNDPVCVGTCLP